MKPPSPQPSHLTRPCAGFFFERVSSVVSTETGLRTAALRLLEPPASQQTTPPLRAQHRTRTRLSTPSRRLHGAYMAENGHKKSPPKQTQVIVFSGAVERNRTSDLLITNQLLYRLSYNGAGRTTEPVVKSEAGIFLHQEKKSTIIPGASQAPGSETAHVKRPWQSIRPAR